MPGGIFTKWKQRWVVLAHDTLCVYKHEEDEVRQVFPFLSIHLHPFLPPLSFFPPPFLLPPILLPSPFKKFILILFLFLFKTHFFRTKNQCTALSSSSANPRWPNPKKENLCLKFMLLEEQCILALLLVVRPPPPYFHFESCFFPMPLHFD